MEVLRIVEKNEDIAFVELDLEGERINKLSLKVLEELEKALIELKHSSYKAVVFISKKSRIFIAGADINELKSIKDKKGFFEASRFGQKIFNLLEDLPMPTVSAIHGACLGGGFEFALSCDYRLASDDKSTLIGLPEVKLGLIPGFGGCYRLPRLIGLVKSLDMILSGRHLDGRKAFKFGVVEQCIPKDVFEEKVLQFTNKILGKKRKIASRGFMSFLMEKTFLKHLIFRGAKKNVMSLTKGFYPAPLKALSVVKKTFGSSQREKSLMEEARCFSEVALTDVSRYLIDLFFLMEKRKKIKYDSAVPVKSVGVLGAGVMGGGIAYVSANKGFAVRMKDIAHKSISQGLKTAYGLFKKQLKRRKITPQQLEEKMSLLSYDLEYTGFKNQDLIIEAVVEDINVKNNVLKEVAQKAPQAILATNTSSLSVNTMAQAVPCPENFVGLHFFNPVDKMPLVEVIQGEKTSEKAIGTAFEYAKKIGKTPIVVKDGPGFLVNRLLLPLLAEGLFFLEQGSSVTFVDNIYKNKFGLPMGIFRLMDEVGWDVCFKVLKIFRDALGDRVEIAEVLEKMAATSLLGKKGGQGFYIYKGRKETADTQIYSKLNLKVTNSLAEEELLERGLFLMINEASRILEEKLVNSAEEVDLAMIMGTGFPPFRGGLLKYADTIGAETIVNKLKKYKERYGVRFEPSPALLNMAQVKSTFY